VGLKSRIVLGDCKDALSDFVYGLQGSAWRRHWLMCLTLLRAVGHILDKVDGERNVILRKIIDGEYHHLKQSKPEPAIYWKFICNERNSMIKTYQTHAGQAITVNLNGPSSSYRYVFNDGPYAGRDQRDVLQEAISWWDAYLHTIEGKCYLMSEQGNTE